MISGMAAAARHLHRDDLAHSAMRAVEFLHENLWIDGRLCASFKDGRARFSAYLDDYAFLLSALIDILQLEWRSELLDFAIELADTLLEHYCDSDNGGFFFTSDDQEKLIHRPRPLADEATPSGNGVAALALARLGHLIGEPRYIDASEATLRSAWGAIAEVPHAHCSLLNALEETLSGTEIVIIRGSGDVLAEWQRTSLLMYAPRRLCYAIPADAQGLPEGIATKQPRGECVAYQCHGSVCGPPLTSLATLTAALRKTG